MKQLNISFLLAMLMSMLGIETFAHDIAVENADGKTIYYVWVNNKTELAVSYRGSDYSSYKNEYSGTIIIPESVSYNEKVYPVTSIESLAFSFCYDLTKVVIPNTVTSIGHSAFSSCTGLISVSISNSVTTIGNGAFEGCFSLTNVSIPSSVISIGKRAFPGKGSLTLMGATPPQLQDNTAFGTSNLIRVPDGSLTTYCGADVWSELASRIVGQSTKIDYDVNVNVDDSRSVLHEVIGEENLNKVVSLKVTGGINGYDIMVMRNKMANLCHLDLTEANIVANSYEYVTGCHTMDNVLPANGFKALGLISIKLPKSITSIGSSAFEGCSYLHEVEFQPGIETIGQSAFKGCSYLKTVNMKEGLKTIRELAFQACERLERVNMKEGLEIIGYQAFGISGGTNSSQTNIEEIVIPNGVKSIGSYAFGNNTKLKRVALPPTLKTIEKGAFYNCSLLEEISIPNNLLSISDEAFKGCSNLIRVYIPSTVSTIGSSAFSGCSKLTDVYTYIVEPPSIEMNTFGLYPSATLHVPTTSYYNYWYDTEWSKFKKVEEFVASYEYFYINEDFTIGEEKGTITGDIDADDPDADLNPGSGLIIETGKTNPQELDEVHIKAKGSDCASVISASNFVANKVYFDIEVSAGRWYFLSFPFNVKKADIQAPGSYVFRNYNPAERANGKVGWQNWIGDLLQKGQGYIFQCAKAGTLSLCVEKAATDWDAENRPQSLTANPATNAQDASWNFVGNPQTSYFDIDKTGYTQPITVWNGTSYDAVRPGDDSYALAPFEAFFVQKPDNQSAMEFPADGRYTKIQWAEEQTKKAAARRMNGVSTDRQLINLTLTDGTSTDKTRVVFNEQKQKGYEMDCDAPKFLSSEQVPQLYTLDQQQSRYAINERPTGEVRLGYVATKNGELTISAQRMDQPMMLRDTKLQITHDLSLGDYTFTTEAGTFESRFVLTPDGSATAVGKLRQMTGVSVMADEGGISFTGIGGQPVNIYSVGGTLLAANVGDGFVSLPKAAYIIKVGTATTKVIVR